MRVPSGFLDGLEILSLDPSGEDALTQFLVRQFETVDYRKTDYTAQLMRVRHTRGGRLHGGDNGTSRLAHTAGIEREEKIA